MVDFSVRLRQILDEKEITQAILSEKTGIAKSKISNYLSGGYKAKQETVYKLAKFFNISEAWLLGYDVPKQKSLKQNEEKLLCYFQQLNEQGQELVIDNTENMVLSQKYIKNCKSEMVEEQTRKINKK